MSRVLLGTRRLSSLAEYARTDPARHEQKQRPRPWVAHDSSQSITKLPNYPIAKFSVTLSSHHVNDDVDGELRVVLAEETLVAPVVVPLAAVVLAAVQHRDSSSPFDRFQVCLLY